MPGYEEMLALWGYASKNAVFGLLRKLQELGYITITRQGKLAFTGRLTGAVKLLGTVQAGFPSPAERPALDRPAADGGR